PRELAVVGRDDERRGERRDALDGRVAQHVEEPEHRPQRVAVRADVAGERNIGGAADSNDSTVERVVDRRAALRRCSSCRWISRMISSTRGPVAMAGSSRNESRGRYFNRTW